MASNSAAAKRRTCSRLCPLQAIHVLLCTLVAAHLPLPAAALKISSVPSGVIVVDKQEVRSVHEWAKIYVTLAQPRNNLEPKYAQFIQELERCYLEIRFKAGQSKTPESKLLSNLLQARLKTLKEQAFPPLSPPGRSRRSPFYFVGDIGSSLFGLARTSDVEALAGVTQNLAGQVEGVVQVQQQVIAKVNVLGRHQTLIAKKLNDVIHQTKEHGRVIEQMLRRFDDLKWEIKRNFESIGILALMDLLDDQMKQYQEISPTGNPKSNLHRNFTLPPPEAIPLELIYHNISTEWAKVQLPPGVSSLERPSYRTLQAVPHKSLLPEINDLQTNRDRPLGGST
ncbi:hypothetical protein CAPTEDRAFT_198433 [Capitella teleta]|uniref:Uncharacterized protein n=1 Tax=Capitella teleta TaxID=283909 RepID=R7TVK5_CAPTE|nr:hypothetical protein CAPTEDRAFT_198433 [Capitella teleta]|eukprot:ELT97913.1 hypothetical protein CAPTEDRAFT_198433 [Capitella teleta]